MKKAQQLLFDMDGTLTLSEQVLHKAWVELASQRGEDFNAFDYNTIFGRRDLEVCKMVADHYGWKDDPAQLHKAYALIVGGLAPKELKLRPGARVSLDKLKRAGAIMALVTSGSPPHVQMTDDKFGILRYFAAVVNSETYGLKRGKPFPDPYILGARKIGARPEECVVFEDSPNGVRSGKAAKCRMVIGLTHEHSSREGLLAAGADVVYDSIEEATNLILDIASAE